MSRVGLLHSDFAKKQYGLEHIALSAVVKAIARTCNRWPVRSLDELARRSDQYAHAQAEWCCVHGAAKNAAKMIEAGSVSPSRNLLKPALS